MHNYSTILFKTYLFLFPCPIFQIPVTRKVNFDKNKKSPKAIVSKSIYTPKNVAKTCSRLDRIQLMCFDVPSSLHKGLWWETPTSDRTIVSFWSIYAIITFVILTAMQDSAGRPRTPWTTRVGRWRTPTDTDVERQRSALCFNDLEWKINVRWIQRDGKKNAADWCNNRRLVRLSN